MTKTCTVCGEPFEAKRSDALTCDDACRQERSRRTRNPQRGPRLRTRSYQKRRAEQREPTLSQDRPYNTPDARSIGRYLTRLREARERIRSSAIRHWGWPTPHHWRWPRYELNRPVSFEPTPEHKLTIWHTSMESVTRSRYHAKQAAGQLPWQIRQREDAIRRSKLFEEKQMTTAVLAEQAKLGLQQSMQGEKLDHIDEKLDNVLEVLRAFQGGETSPDEWERWMDGRT